MDACGYYVKASDKLYEVNNPTLFPLDLDDFSIDKNYQQVFDQFKHFYMKK